MSLHGEVKECCQRRKRWLQVATLPLCHLMWVRQKTHVTQYRILRDEVASLEVALSLHGCTSSSNVLLIYIIQWIAIRMVLIIGSAQADPSANKDQMCYCIHVRVTVGEGRDDQLTTSPCVDKLIDC